MQGLVEGRPNLLGCLVTRWQDNRGNRDEVNKLEDRFLIPNQIPLFKTRIKFDANVQKDEGGGFHIPGLGQRTAALQYTEFTEEVLKHVHESHDA
jgi:hypothetical protein